MSTQHKNEKRNKLRKEVKRRSWEWCRIYPVDFMRAEDAYDIGALSKLELEVKTNLAQAPSPCDELIAREEEEDREKEAERLEQLRERLHAHAADSGLTEKQLECFKLLCEEGVPIPEAAEKMRITPQRVREMFGQIELRIKRFLAEQDLSKRVIEYLRIEGDSLKPLDRQILTLRYVKKMELKEIGDCVKRDVSRISRRLEKLSGVIKRK